MKSASTTYLRAAFLIALGSAVAALPACTKPAAPPAEAKKGRPPVPVLVAKVAEADMPLEIRAVGTVEPVQSSPVRSQIAGTITEVRFREGDRVKAGQVLFQIDKRPIEATIKQLQANLGRDEAQVRNAEAQALSAEAQVRSMEAQLKNAEAQAKRYEELMQKELVAREQYDQRMTNLDAARAALDAARAAGQSTRAGLEATRAAADATRAAIENARLQLDYTLITAPVSGQAGSLRVDKGDLVKVNDTVLVVINQIQPILARFSVPEPRLPEVQRYRTAGSLTVRVDQPGVEGASRGGRIVFIDNEVDRATGTIALKAEFDNADAALWPGQSVNVTLVLTVRQKAMVVPAQAVQNGQQGPYVFVVDQGGVAAIRPVVPGEASGNLAIIEKGLAPGETVVTDGQLRLTPGAPVMVKTELGGPAAGAPGGGGPRAGKEAPGAEKPH